VLVRGTKEAQQTHPSQINASGDGRESYRGDGIGEGNCGIGCQGGEPVSVGAIVDLQQLGAFCRGALLLALFEKWDSSVASILGFRFCRFPEAQKYFITEPCDPRLANWLTYPEIRICFYRPDRGMSCCILLATKKISVDLRFTCEFTRAALSFLCDRRIVPPVRRQLCRLQ
jgi:hypothetical protein